MGKIQTGTRYSCNIDIPVECENSKRDFKVFFSCIVKDFDDTQNIVYLTGFNPIELEELVKKYKTFSIFLHENSKSIVCSYSHSNGNMLVAKQTAEFIEKRRSFRIPVCENEFKINGKEAIIINISASGLSFICDREPPQIVHLEGNNNKTIKVKIIETRKEDGKYIARGKILITNFNLYRFISEKYLQICKEILKRECIE